MTHAARMSTDEPTQASPVNFWFTDRTHYEQGVGFCQRARYLEKHSGPTGYGIVAAGESLPLATGTYVHQACAELFSYMKEKDATPPEEIVRAAVNRANGAYEELIALRGFRGLLESEVSEVVITEQKALLTGMIWAFALQFLPWFHQQFVVMAVEEPRNYLLTCSCGVDRQLPLAVHAANNCTGIVLSQRLDLLARRRSSSSLVYFEIKTTGSDRERFASDWETRPQLGLGTLGIERQYGGELTEMFVVGLQKGYRDKIRDADGKVTGTRQASPFCYGYKLAGNPPMTADDWKPQYRWVDEYGKTKQVSRAHEKTGVWELVDSDWPTYAPYKGQLDPAEVWARALPESVLQAQLFIVGPLNRQDTQIRGIVRSLVAEEERWQGIVWKLYEESLRRQLVWSSPDFQDLLDELIPCSWNCRKYGAAHTCQFKNLCFKENGWEDPIGSWRYRPRVPHHEGEKQQAMARGLLPAEGLTEEVDE